MAKRKWKRVWRKDPEAAAKRPRSPCRNVQWHIRKKRWTVYIVRVDSSVNPTRTRRFCKNFTDVDDAVRVRDAVDRMLSGPKARQFGDGKLPEDVTRLHLIQWCSAQGTFDPEEAPRFGGRLSYFDRNNSDE